MVETGQKLTRVCVKCGEVKALDLFVKDSGCALGRRPVCKACKNKDMKEYHDLFPAKRNKHYGKFILKKYGLTWDSHEALILRAAGYCESCGSQFTGMKTAIHIDHCHTTKDVRGLLCGGCNTAAGNLIDCPDTIFSLIKYIMETRYNPFLKSEDLHLSKKTT